MYNWKIFYTWKEWKKEKERETVCHGHGHDEKSGGVKEERMCGGRKCEKREGDTNR